MTIMSGQNVYIVGKGPSLDYISKKDFPNIYNSVICLNDSILKVDSLGLPNPMYVVQQDGGVLGHKCVPKRGILFISCFSAHTVMDCKFKTVYCPKDFRCTHSTPSVIMAIHIARYFGAKRFTFLCFDSCLSGDITQAACAITYERDREYPIYKSHKKWIRNAVGKVPFKFTDVKNK